MIYYPDQPYLRDDDNLSRDLIHGNSQNATQNPSAGLNVDYNWQYWDPPFKSWFFISFI